MNAFQNNRYRNTLRYIINILLSDFSWCS